jgi:hypothetical protein
VVLHHLRIAAVQRALLVQNLWSHACTCLQICYVSPYQGRERGVLLQLGQEQLGHLPLGLFDEDMKNPPPPLE